MLTALAGFLAHSFVPLSLKGRLDAGRLSSPHGQLPASLPAYEPTLRARTLLWKGGAHRIRGKAQLEQAVTLDPGFAEPRAWLAVYFYQDWLLHGREPAKTAMNNAEVNARKAVELDPENSTA